MGRAALQPSVVGFADPADPAAAGRALELRLLAWRALGALCAVDYEIAARAHAGGWTRLLAAWASGGGVATAAATGHCARAGAAGSGGACEADPWVGRGWSASQARALREAALEGLTTLAVSCPAVRTCSSDVV